MKKLALLILTSLIVSGNSFAQDTLPSISVRNVGSKRVVVEWRNRFENVKQISIQRSADSLRNYKTILTVADPGLPENGYLDTKAPADNMFYRVYIMLDKGVFLFSNSKRPVYDTTALRKIAMVRPDNPTLTQPINGDSVFNGPTINGGIPNRVKTETWVPSKYVFTQKDGYIRINLPEDDKKYSIKFFTLHDEPMFELKDIKEKSFKIDKANFYQAGWYKFELYEDGELKEKNRFYLPREF